MIPAFSKVSNIVGFSEIYLVKTTAIIACKTTIKATPTAYLLAASLPFSKLIFKAVIFNMLGVIEPTKAKKNPKKKSENNTIKKNSFRF